MLDQTQKSVTERDYSILRIIGIILVLIGHSSYTTLITIYGGVDLSAVYVNRTAVFPWILFVIELIYAFHMPLFLFVSGAVYSHGRVQGKYGNIMEFINTKFMRLIVPYFAAAILFMVPIKLLTHFYKPDISMLKIIGNGIMLSLDSGHLWYVFMLFIIFVIFRCAEGSILIKKRFWIYFSLLLLLHFLSQNLTTNIFQISSLLKYFVYFYIGYGFDQYKSQILSYLSSKKVWIFLLTFTYFMVINLYIRDPLLPKLNQQILLFIDSILGISWLYILVLILVDISNVLNLNKLSHLEKMLDKNSFIVYLLHDPFNYIIMYFLFRTKALGYIASSEIFTILFVSSRIIIPMISSIYLWFIVKTMINKLQFTLNKIRVDNKFNLI